MTSTAERSTDEVYEVPPLRWSEGPPEMFLKSSCSFSGCERKPGVGFSVCHIHAWRTFDELAALTPPDSLMARLKLKSKIRSAEKAPETTARSFTQVQEYMKTGPKVGVIYYLRVSGLIKIGFTTNLEQRVKAYPPDTELLAAHRGTMKTERAMHTRFCAELAGRREWFRESDELMAHIHRVRDESGDPQQFFFSEPKRERKPGPRLRSRSR